MFRERMLKSKKKKVSPTLSPSYKVTNKRPRNRAANGALFQTGLLIFIIFFGLLFFICILNGFHPPEPSSAVFNRVSNNYGKSSHSHGYTEKRASDQTIFIAMPSTNDPDCNASIISAFENAQNPDRIFFGIHQQTNLDKYNDCLDFSSIECPEHPICHRLWQISITRVSDKSAYGPTFGRYMSDLLFNDEDFYFITDSHSFFRPNWDSIIIKLWTDINNEYAVITHYPKGTDHYSQSVKQWESDPSQGKAYHICGTFWEASENHMPRNANGCYVAIKDLQPILVPFWGAGLSFSKSHFRSVVPFDPYTQWIFHGEEFHTASRLWTFGYDFYSPPFDIIFHRYSDKAKRGKMEWNKNIEEKRDSSEKRVNFLWDLLDIRTPEKEKIAKANLTDIEKYGLGNKRSLEQFWEFVGCDPVKQSITIFDEDIWRNGGLKRISWNKPFDERDPFAKKL